MKLLTAITLLLIAGVAFGDNINLTLNNNANGTCTLGYSGYTGNPMISISIKVTTSAPVTYVAGSTNSFFNFFPDFFYTNPLNYTLGIGHPIAITNQPGATSSTNNLTSFSISLAGFSTTSNAPNSQTALATLSGTNGTTVTVESDNKRGCIYNTKGKSMTTNLPLQCTITN